MRVALYPRVSGHEQEDNYSIPEQIERMKKYCESRDWMVYKIYTDSGFSGASLERPGLQAMIKDVEDGKVDMVLVYKLDRLSRSRIPLARGFSPPKARNCRTGCRGSNLHFGCLPRTSVRTTGARTTRG